MAKSKHSLGKVIKPTKAVQPVYKPEKLEKSTNTSNKKLRAAKFR